MATTTKKARQPRKATNKTSAPKAAPVEPVEPVEPVAPVNGASNPAATLVDALASALAAVDDNGQLADEHKQAIGHALKSVRGNNRTSTAMTWAVGAMATDPAKVAVVMAVVADPPGAVRAAAPAMPEHEVLAHRLALLESAGDRLRADATDEVVEQALAMLAADGYDLPTKLSGRVEKVVKTASTGTGPRNTGDGGHNGERVDLGTAVIEGLQLHPLGARVPFAQLKRELVASHGISQGDAIGNVFTRLTDCIGADGDGTAQSKALHAAGIRTSGVGPDRVWVRT